MNETMSYINAVNLSQSVTDLFFVRIQKQKRRMANEMERKHYQKRRTMQLSPHASKHLSSNSEKAAVCWLGQGRPTRFFSPPARWGLLDFIRGVCARVLARSAPFRQLQTPVGSARLHPIYASPRLDWGPRQHQTPVGSPSTISVYIYIYIR